MRPPDESNEVAIFAALVALLGFMLFVMACSSPANDPNPMLRGPESQPRTLAVRNTGLDPVTLRYRGRKLRTLHPGERACIDLSSFATPGAVARIEVDPLSRDSFWTPRVNFRDAPGWSLGLGTNLRFDVLSLQPAPRCDP